IRGSPPTASLERNSPEGLRATSMSPVAERAAGSTRPRRATSSGASVPTHDSDDALSAHAKARAAMAKALALRNAKQLRMPPPSLPTLPSYAGREDPKSSRSRSRFPRAARGVRELSDLGQPL